MKKWESYQEVARYLLNQFSDKFGLDRVEGKQEVQGKRSGTTWKIDAKGIKDGNEVFIIVECRRYTTSKQSQEKVGGLAYRIIDTGPDGGILVSPLGVQRGATKISAAENIIEVHLDENSTRHEFVMGFLNEIMLGVKDNIRIAEEEVRIKIVNETED